MTNDEQVYSRPLLPPSRSRPQPAAEAANGRSWLPLPLQLRPSSSSAAYWALAKGRRHWCGGFRDALVEQRWQRCSSVERRAATSTSSRTARPRATRPSPRPQPRSKSRWSTRTMEHATVLGSYARRPMVGSRRSLARRPSPSRSLRSGLPSASDSNSKDATRARRESASKLSVVPNRRPPRGRGHTRHRAGARDRAATILTGKIDLPRQVFGIQLERLIVHSGCTIDRVIRCCSERFAI